MTVTQTRPLTTHDWIVCEAQVILIRSGAVIEKCLVWGTLQVCWHRADDEVYDLRSFGGAGIGAGFAEAGDAAFEDALRNMRRCQALDRREENRCDEANRETTEAPS